MLLDTRTEKRLKVPLRRPRATFTVVPASQFSLQELTDIYNETRVDYLVPMPMNKAKVQEYVHNYDIDLKQSVVAISGGSPLGLAMLGVRGDQTWITRLGVTPSGRKKGVGRRLMNTLIANSKKLGAQRITLEVIKDNKPAQTLFESLGFQIVQDLLVIRRPPAPMYMALTHRQYIKKLGYQESLAILENRRGRASWVSDTASMHNAGNLSGLVADFPNMGKGWLVYQNSVFQLSRLILETETNASLEVATALLQYLHECHPAQDTIVENLPADDKHWPAFQALGYLTSFTRIEMHLDLFRSN